MSSLPGRALPLSNVDAPLHFDFRDIGVEGFQDLGVTEGGDRREASKEVFGQVGEFGRGWVEVGLHGVRQGIQDSCRVCGNGTVRAPVAGDLLMLDWFEKSRDGS